MSRPARLANVGREAAIAAIMLGTSRAAKVAGLVLLAVLAGIVLGWFIVNGLVPIVLIVLALAAEHRRG